MKRGKFERMVENEFETYGVFGGLVHTLRKRYNKEFEGLYRGLLECDDVEEAYWIRVDNDDFHGGIATIVVDICDAENVGIFKE